MADASCAAQDAASLCDGCSKDIHEANPLAGRHVLEPVQPFANAATGVTLEGTRVAASANAAEVEEYRRQCEELLNTEEGAETVTASGGAAAGRGAQATAAGVVPPWHAPQAPPAADSGGGGSGVGELGERATRKALRGDAVSLAPLQGVPVSGSLPSFGDPFDAFLGDFAELDGDEPLEFAFLQAHGARGSRAARALGFPCGRPRANAARRLTRAPPARVFAAGLLSEVDAPRAAAGAPFGAGLQQARYSQLIRRAQVAAPALTPPRACEQALQHPAKQERGAAGGTHAFASPQGQDRRLAGGSAAAVGPRPGPPADGAAALGAEVRLRALAPLAAHGRAPEELHTVLRVVSRCCVRPRLGAAAAA